MGDMYGQAEDAGRRGERRSRGGTAAGVANTPEKSSKGGPRPAPIGGQGGRGGRRKGGPRGAAPQALSEADRGDGDGHAPTAAPSPLPLSTRRGGRARPYSAEGEPSAV